MALALAVVITTAHFWPWRSPQILCHTISLVKLWHLPHCQAVASPTDFVPHKPHLCVAFATDRERGERHWLARPERRGSQSSREEVAEKICISHKHKHTHCSQQSSTLCQYNNTSTILYNAHCHYYQTRGYNNHRLGK